MADVIKKGLLEVKKRNRFGGYKLKYVLLCNSITLKCKTVEILDTDGLKNNEVIRLNDIWSVQDKPSRSRYAFELVLGDDPILTFSCATIVEREEWTEAFRVLNQLALPSMDDAGSPMTDKFYPVTLMKNHSALEIGHSGQYLLSITGSAVVLHWRTGAIAHHWPTKNITKLYHPGREGHLRLNVRRVSGSGAPQEFEFITDKENAVQVLKLWNIRLLESIPGDPEQLNEISSSLTTTVQTSGKMNRKSKSFKAKGRIVDQDHPFVRTGSLTHRKTYDTYTTSGGTAGLSQVAPTRVTYGESRSLTGNSQDSFFSLHKRGASSPPPLPPRPEEDSSDDDDPDYAYIDETEVKGPDGTQVKRTPSSELDDQLAELKKSISRENRLKRREAERKKEQTIHRLRTTLEYTPADPQDYLIPVPSKRSQSLSTSSETKDLSENPQELSPSSNEGNSPVFASHTSSTTPHVRSYGVNENTENKQKDYYNERTGHAPPIPPRSPNKSRKTSSTSSLGSGGSSTRCPKCHSIRKAKSSVGKTISLDPRYGHSRMSKEDARKSMPNLDTHHCCSQESDHTPTAPPTANANSYLQLVDEKPPSKPGYKSELGPELDLLTSCLQTLESLNKNREEPLFKEEPKPAKKKRSPYDQLKLKSETASKSQEKTTVPDPPPRASTTGTHRPLTTSQSWLQTSAFNISSPQPVRNRTSLPPGSLHQNPRSHSSIGHAPPVPPRSSVSLTNVQNGSLRNSQTLGRSRTITAPPRSKSVLDTHYKSQYGEPEKSKTVFIHHVKDRRSLPLAHMV